MLTPTLEPGSYVLAISGGVDSVSMLHALNELKVETNKNKVDESKLNKTYTFVVAHFNHGMRVDSDMDRKLVQQLAHKYQLPFVYQNGNLGIGTSEDVARNARYTFLRKVQKASNAHAIVTAHHQDDLIETAIFNMLRGTGRRGISSLADVPHLRRPLLHVSKDDIKQYAKDQGLVWHEDYTNADTTITRNYIRNVLVPKIGSRGKASLVDSINHIKVLNQAIDNDLLVYLHTQPSRQTLDRHSFVLLPHSVALEVMASWLRSHGISQFDSKLLERLVAKCKTLTPGKHVDVNTNFQIHIGRESLVLTKREK